MKIKISVNGREAELTANATLSEVIRLQLNLASSDEAKGVAAALNGTVIPKNDWSSTSINENDAVEIVHAVQGG